MTTDGLRSALLQRPDIARAEVFYPFDYGGLHGHAWDIVIIEGWFQVLSLTTDPKPNGLSYIDSLRWPVHRFLYP